MLTWLLVGFETDMYFKHYVVDILKNNNIIQCVLHETFITI